MCLQDECEELKLRIKGGLLKQPTIVSSLLLMPFGISCYSFHFFKQKLKDFLTWIILQSASIKFVTNICVRLLVMVRELLLLSGSTIVLSLIPWTSCIYSLMSSSFDKLTIAHGERWYCMIIYFDINHFSNCNKLSMD